MKIKDSFDPENAGLNKIQQDIENVGDDKKTTKKAISKKELLDENKELKKKLNAFSISSDMSEQIVKPITKGIFSETAKYTKYPFDEIDEVLKDNFDKSCSKTMAYYMGDMTIIPPIELAINLATIIATVLLKGKKETLKISNVKPELNKTNTGKINEIDLSTGEIL